MQLRFYGKAVCVISWTNSRCVLIKKSKTLHVAGQDNNINTLVDTSISSWNKKVDCPFSSRTGLLPFVRRVWVWNFYRYFQYLFRF